jgi:hypothetical protein
VKHIPNDWSEKQNALKLLLSNEYTFDKGIKLLCDMHGQLHNGNVYGNVTETLYDNLWDNLKIETCKRRTNKGTSIIWNIWHISRIEDIVANILIGNRDEVLNNDYELNIKIRDTGNAMNKKEIMALNNDINIEALKRYRMDVGKRTRNIIN